MKRHKHPLHQWLSVVYRCGKEMPTEVACSRIYNHPGECVAMMCDAYHADTGREWKEDYTTLPEPKKEEL